jgi:spermidine/putrescine-binding protein
MKRRLVLLLTVLALIAAACGDGDAEDTTTTSGETTTTTEATATVCAPGETDGDLILYNWTDYLPTGPDAEDAEVTDLIEEFESEYGVTVTQDFFTNNEELRAKLQAGATGYDVIVPSDYMVSQLATDGLLMELQRDAIPNWTNLDPDFVNPPFDPEHKYHMPYQWGTSGIGISWNDLPDDFDYSWSLIFDPAIADEYSGLITMLDDARESMAAALRYLGYSINTTDEAELQAAADLIKETIPRLATFDSDTFEDLLVGGETVIAHGWSGDFFLAFDENDAWEDYGYFIPDEGGVRWVDTMAVPVSAPHPCTAHTFINFILDPFYGAELTNYNYYGSPNAAAEEHIWEEILEDEAIYPSEETLANLEIIADLGPINATIENLFEEARS